MNKPQSQHVCSRKLKRMGYPHASIRTVLRMCNHREQPEPYCASDCVSNLTGVLKRVLQNPNEWLHVQFFGPIARKLGENK